MRSALLSIPIAILQLLASTSGAAQAQGIRPGGIPSMTPAIIAAEIDSHLGDMTALITFPMQPREEPLRPFLQAGTRYQSTDIPLTAPGLPTPPFSDDPVKASVGGGLSLELTPGHALRGLLEYEPAINLNQNATRIEPDLGPDKAAIRFEYHFRF